jgi:hypothetical protein
MPLPPPGITASRTGGALADTLETAQNNNKMKAHKNKTMLLDRWLSILVWHLASKDEQADK